MSKLQKLVDRALDWLPGPGLVYILAAVAGLNFAADQIAAAAPEGSETVVQWLLLAATWLGGVAQAIRRGTEVPAILRGLRLPEGTQMELTAKTPNATVMTAKDSDGVTTTVTETRP